MNLGNGTASTVCHYCFKPFLHVFIRKLSLHMYDRNSETLTFLDIKNFFHRVFLEFLDRSLCLAWHHLIHFKNTPLISEHIWFIMKVKYSAIRKEGEKS